MPDIRIHRDHQLGLARAREVAWQWAEEAEQRLGMDCTMVEGDTTDTLEFSRSGVKGQLLVAGDHFAVDAKLGFLLAAFSRSIESEIEKNLDSLLAAEAAKVPAKRARPVAKNAAAKGAAKTAAKVAAKAAARVAGKSPRK